MPLLFSGEIRFMRQRLATALLLFLVFIAPFLNRNSTPAWANSQTALLQLIFVIVFLPEVKHWIIIIYKKSPVFKMVLWCVLVALLGSVLGERASLQESRLWIYLIQLFFFVATVAWFHDRADKQLYILAVVKIASVIFLCGFMLALLASQSGEVATRRDIDLFIYRNIRHLNYDLAAGFLMGVAAWCMVRPSSLNTFLFCIMFSLLGFVSLFTEGRGQLLSVGLFILVALYAVGKGGVRVVLTQAGLCTILGFLVLFTLYPESLDWLFRRSFNEDVDRASSGRLGIWVRSLEYWYGDGTDLRRIVFGAGPDSFRLDQLHPGLVQPHNSLVQATIEFGLLGATLLMYLVFQAVRLLTRSAKDGRRMQCLMSCAILSMLFYSLFDGVLYHAGPLLICILFSAYLFSSSWSIKNISG